MAARLLVISVALAAGVFAYQVARTGFALVEASNEARQLRAQVADGDFQRADRTADRLRAHARSAHDHSDGFLWRGATLLPLLGDDVDAIRRLAQVLDGLSADASGPLLEAARDVTERPLRRDDGTFDTGAARALRPSLERAGSAAARADRRLRDVDSQRLVGPLAGPVSDAKQQITRLDAGLRAGVAFTELLPSLLGEDGARQYLLVVQNNAESRATGGLPGSVSVLSARDGRLKLGQQGTAADFGPPGGRPVATLGPGERKLFGEDMATDFRDTNATPDFPRAASLMAAMADRVLARPVDGVVSVDPVALASMLESAGPIQAGRTELDATNVVRRLLFEPYQRFPDDQEQNAFFAATSAAIFDAVLQGGLDERAVLAGLGAGVQQRRVTMWSRHPGEQRRLEEAGVTGALPSGSPSDAEVGMYLNSATRAKIQYFLRYRGDVRSLTCVDDRQVIQARLQLVSKVPTPVSQLAPYVSGLGPEAPRGDNLLNVSVVAPSGGRLTALAVNGRPVDVATGVVSGRDVVVFPVRLRPGDDVEVVADVETARGQRRDPRFEWTPGLAAGDTEDVAPSACR